MNFSEINPGRFWSKVKKLGEDRTLCWLWIGTGDGKGYGRLELKDGSRIKAHRYSYLLHGGVLKDGECVLHRCDNPSCVNPEHLFAGSRGDNNRDRNAKGRTRSNPPKGEAHPSAKISEVEAREILAAKRSGQRVSVISRERNLNYLLVWRVATGRLWKHLHEDGVAHEGR